MTHGNAAGLVPMHSKCTPTAPLLCMQDRQPHRRLLQLHQARNLEAGRMHAGVLEGLHCELDDAGNRDL